MTQQEAARCRMVHLEWDRGHESFDAIVRSESPEGVILTEVHDLSCLPGLRWIRGVEVVSMVDLDDEAPAVRLADLRGSRTAVVPAPSTSLHELLVQMRSDRSLVALNTVRSGAGAVTVGFVEAVDDKQVTLDPVNPDGKRDPEAESLQLDEIIGLKWGDEYLEGLAELLVAEGS